jgi:K+-sensing histidine kinase KdpD
MMNGTPLPESIFRLYDYIPHGMIVIRSDYTVVFWNARMADWTSISPAQAVGMNILDQYPSLKNPSVISRITQLFEGGPAVLFSPLFHPHLIPCPLPDGTQRVQKISCIPMDYENGILALTFIEDVSDLTNQVKAYREMKKVAEGQLEELTKARDAIFQANKKLSLLNSITRHDIRNQLMALRTYIELSKDTLDDAATLKEYIMKEELAAEAIQRQIEFTSVYQDTGVKSAAWQDVADTIGTATESLDLKGAVQKVDLPAVEIFADPLLQKVFYNLAENSLRHGEGITRIQFSCTESATALILIYEDDGVGVPAEVKERIFRREYFKNTGFGLFLSREILGITNMTISEVGTPGQGVRFEIKIPKNMYRFTVKK